MWAPRQEKNLVGQTKVSCFGVSDVCRNLAPGKYLLQYYSISGRCRNFPELKYSISAYTLLYISHVFCVSVYTHVPKIRTNTRRRK